MSNSPPAQDQQNFVRTSKFVSFYLELYKNKFKNLIQTRFIFSFRELHKPLEIIYLSLNMSYRLIAFLFYKKPRDIEQTLKIVL